MVAFRQQPAERLMTLLIYISLTYGTLVFYQQFTQAITSGGADMAQQIDTSIEEQVGSAIANLTGNMSASSWNIVTNPAASIRYYLILLALAAVQVAMLGIIAFGFVAIGALVLIGPVMIPFILIPGLDFIATGWFRCLVQYSFYPVIGNAFVYVYAMVWLNYFQQFNGPMDAATIARLILQIIVLSIAGVFGILKIPSFVSQIFSGSSGLSAMPGIGWWR